jgi:serine phosphatase RsbU (regulator of sigma subunit)
MSAKELLQLPANSKETLLMSQFESKATIGEVYEEITSYTGEKIPVEIDRFPLIENRQIIGYFYTLRDLREAIENERLAKEKSVTDFEIETAAAVQKDFYSEISSGDQIGFVSYPFKRLNGDFYNILKQGSKTMVTIADISGKGIPAAIQTSLMIGAIEHVNLHHEKPDQFVEFINRMFSKYSKSEHFMTLFTMIYDEETRMLQYCSAGHEPSLLYNKGTNTFNFLETKEQRLAFSRSII